MSRNITLFLDAVYVQLSYYVQELMQVAHTFVIFLLVILIFWMLYLMHRVY